MREEDTMNTHRNITPTQIPMPGIYPRTALTPRMVSEQLPPGAEVTYHGHIRGGPRYGATGIVREIRGRRIVVDLLDGGVWHIPFYFLSAPQQAA